MLPNEYNKAIRRGNSDSGMHVYINGELTGYALQNAGLPLSATNLECKATAMTDRRGVACVRLRIRKIKEGK